MAAIFRKIWHLQNNARKAGLQAGNLTLPAFFAIPVPDAQYLPAPPEKRIFAPVCRLFPACALWRRGFCLPQRRRQSDRRTRRKLRNGQTMPVVTAQGKTFRQIVHYVVQSSFLRFRIAVIKRMLSFEHFFIFSQ